MSEESAAPISTSTPISVGTSQSKKRELSSPEFDFDIKKNKLRPDSESTASVSEISDIMASEVPKVDGVGKSEAAANVTLQEGHIRSIAALMKDSFQPHVSQIIQESFQQQLTTLVNSIVEGVLQGLHLKIDALQKENDELRKRVQKLEETVDSSEQYSRRNCLRVTGIPVTENESTDDIVVTLASSIGVDLEVKDIDRSHRLGRQEPARDQTPRPRDIIVKFASYRMRAKFYKARVLTKSRGY